MLVSAGRRTAIDRDLVRVKHGDIRRAIVQGAALVEAAAPEELPAFLAAYDAGWKDFQEASRARLLGLSGAVRYSRKARVAATLSVPEILRFRRRVTERITGTARSPPHDAEFAIAGPIIGSRSAGSNSRASS